MIPQILDDEPYWTELRHHLESLSNDGATVKVLITDPHTFLSHLADQKTGSTPSTFIDEAVDYINNNLEKYRLGLFSSTLLLVMSYEDFGQALHGTRMKENNLEVLFQLYKEIKTSRPDSEKGKTENYNLAYEAWMKKSRERLSGYIKFS